MFANKNAAEAQIRNLIDDLLRASCDHSVNGKCDYSEESLQALKQLGKLEPAWGIDAVRVDEDDIDRRSNMFGGKPFTTKNHPWPINSKGKPYYPLIQVDLAQVSNVVGKNFGDGLLQIWLDITKNDLDNCVRIIDGDDLLDQLEDDVPLPSRIKKTDKDGFWFGTCSQFTFKPAGFMMAHWFDGALEWDYERDLSDKEVEVLSALEKLSEDNGYRSMSGSWLLGYPDRGSGSPAGRYFPEPKSFIQFSDSSSFPMVDVSRYANIFYSDDEGDLSFFFDWNG